MTYVTDYSVFKARVCQVLAIIKDSQQEYDKSHKNERVPSHVKPIPYLETKNDMCEIFCVWPSNDEFICLYDDSGGVVVLKSFALPLALLDMDTGAIFRWTQDQMEYVRQEYQAYAQMANRYNTKDRSLRAYHNICTKKADET